MYLRTEAIVLNRRNFGEADRILTLYTRHSGKIAALAKGVRRPASKKTGHLELGSWCKVFLARGKNLDLITEVETKRAFGISHFHEDKANKIYHLLEVIDHLTAIGQSNQQVFALLVRFLKRIESGEDFNLVSSIFKVKLLAILGFFSTKSLANSRAKKLFQIFEEEDFDSIKYKINLSQNSYLKLTSFLDSIIESLAQTKLKTNRFL